jgi:hypothetical protein
MKWMLISLAYNSMMNEEKELSLRLKLLEMRERIWLADGRLRRRGVLAEIARELGVSRQCVGTAARRAINGCTARRASGRPRCWRTTASTTRRENYDFHLRTAAGLGDAGSPYTEQAAP